MSAPTPATVANIVTSKEAAKRAASEDVQQAERLLRSLDGRLRGCAPKFAGALLKQRKEVKARIAKDRRILGK